MNLVKEGSDLVTGCVAWAACAKTLDYSHSGHNQAGASGRESEISRLGIHSRRMARLHHAVSKIKLQGGSISRRGRKTSGTLKTLFNVIDMTARVSLRSSLALILKVVGATARSSMESRYRTFARSKLRQKRQMISTDTFGNE